MAAFVRRPEPLSWGVRCAEIKRNKKKGDEKAMSPPTLCSETKTGLYPSRRQLLSQLLEG